jgi:uncharacterized protein
MAILRKIKEKITKIMRKKKTSKILKEIPIRFRRKKAVAKVEKELIGTREVAVEKAKYFTPEPVMAHREMPHDLPGEYGKDRIILQTRDPWWLHTYWEVVPHTFERLRGELGEAFHQAKRLLRVYDVTSVVFNGVNANRFFDLEINPMSNSWYIDTGGPGRSWCVDLGLLLPDGRFITIVRSNTAYTPLEGPSWITDEEWMVPDEMFARLYGMGFGFGRSSPVGKAWQERMRRALFSGILASPGMAVTSVGSPVKKIPKERKFWLVVNTELIVYGATEPDAKVKVQGRDIKLRPDGTFSLRFALPDGKQVIPVHATSSDGIDERTITPIVTRETK